MDLTIVMYGDLSSEKNWFYPDGWQKKHTKQNGDYFCTIRFRPVVKRLKIMYLDLFNKDILVVGCGNPLLGDDGFGPAVIESLEMQQIQADHIGLLDAGTSVRELLFDLLLSSPIPKTLILIDAVQHSSARPGDIIAIDVDQIPENKVADYSLHQFPTTNMLKELRDSGLIDIKIYAVQVETIPKLVKPGLSRPVKKAVIKLSNLIKLKVYDENFYPVTGSLSDAFTF